MTCIVGLVHQDSVWVGGDSAGVAGYSLSVRADEKVFRRGPFVMGFTSSFRMGQLLHYKLRVPTSLPATYHKDPDKWMATTFVDAVRKCLKDGGYARTHNDEERGGVFVVAEGGNLWTIESDYQVARPACGYTAVGCGQDLALGALHTLTRDPDDDPREVLREALEAAEAHSAGVCGPFTILNTSSTGGSAI